MATKKKKTPADSDWENRILCSDESCIGIIGANGKCRVCGTPHPGEIPESLAALSVDEDQDPDEETTAWDEDTELQEAEGEVSADAEWAERRLCVDESCIGVIGPDGRCKECGKPYSA